MIRGLVAVEGGEVALPAPPPAAAAALVAVEVGPAPLREEDTLVRDDPGGVRAGRGIICARAHTHVYLLYICNAVARAAFGLEICVRKL